MKNLLPTGSWVLATALCLCYFASCSKDNKVADNTRHAFDRVIKDDVPFRDFDVDAANNDTIRLDEGTGIYIPKGIFVDAKGNPVNGKVQLHYRAFYTPGEIIASGITMRYDTAGAAHTFSSAGMFEISGTQNGEPISIAPGKSINMDFASSRNDDAYNFYTLDTANAKWGFVSTSTAEPNVLREQLLASISKLMTKPAEPHLYDPAKPVINIDVDINDHPELKGYSNVMWQYAGTGTDPEKNKWIYDENWTSAQLQMADSATCMYNMKLSDNTRSFTTNVFPSFKGENYKAALADFKKDMVVFETEERERQEARMNIALTQQFQRSLSLPRFGLCNFDRWVQFGKVLINRVRFHFSDPSFADHPENVAVYVCTVGNQFVTSYIGSDMPEIAYIPSRNNCIIAVQRGTGKVEVLNNSEFLERMPKSSAGFGELSLHSTSKIVSDSKDLDAIIATL